MAQHMPVQVVDVDDGDAQAQRESLCETSAHEERAQQTRAAGEGDGAEVLAVDAGAAQGGVDDGHDVLLVGAACQLGYHASVFLVHALAGDDVAEQDAVTDDGGAGVVAR